MYGEDEVGPITESLLTAIRKNFVYLSYGEFEGMRNPTVAELYMIRGLIDGAIEEKRKDT